MKGQSGRPMQSK